MQFIRYKAHSLNYLISKFEPNRTSSSRDTAIFDVFTPLGPKSMKKWDISGTTRPIRLKFWEQVVETVPLVPYEVHLPKNASHSTGKQVSNLKGSVQLLRPSTVCSWVKRVTTIHLSLEWVHAQLQVFEGSRAMFAQQKVGWIKVRCSKISRLVFELFRLQYLSVDPIIHLKNIVQAKGHSQHLPNYEDPRMKTVRIQIGFNLGCGKMTLIWIKQRLDIFRLTQTKKWRESAVLGNPNLCNHQTFHYISSNENHEKFQENCITKHHLSSSDIRMRPLNDSDDNLPLQWFEMQNFK